MKRPLIFLCTFLCIVLTGCTDRDTGQVLDKDGTVLVGEYDGCSIYYTRTKSPAPNVTWIRCKKTPKTVETNHTESCGKGCTREVKTITVEDEK